jgi:hypothetical protein
MAAVLPLPRPQRRATPRLTATRADVTIDSPPRRSRLEFAVFHAPVVMAYRHVALARNALGAACRPEGAGPIRPPRSFAVSGVKVSAAHKP